MKPLSKIIFSPGRPTRRPVEITHRGYITGRGIELRNRLSELMPPKTRSEVVIIDVPGTDSDTQPNGSHLEILDRITDGLAFGTTLSTEGRVARTLHELYCNTLMHGWGGIISVSKISGEEGEEIEIASLDRGPGLHDFFSLLIKSARAHVFKSDSGYGTASLALMPDRMELCSNGQRWYREDGDIDFRVGESSVSRGVFYRAGFHLRPGLGKKIRPAISMFGLLPQVLRDGFN